MILLTGFEPFQGEQLNPSKDIVRGLATSSRLDIETVILPVVFERAFDQVQEIHRRKHFEFILMLGQAGGRKSICLERIAINRIDTEVADEEGQWWLDRKILEAAPEAFISDLPLRDWTAELRRQGHDVEISNSAGLFVCNSLYYQVSQLLRVRSLFVHVPYSADQGKLPSQTLGQMTDCITDLLSLIRTNIK